MADNQFKLANAIIPEVFANYVLNQSMKTNRLVQSGILTNDPSLGSQLLAPGDFIHMPYINDIAEGPDAQTWTDTQDISVNGLTTGEQRAFKFRQAQAFGWTDVSQQVSGAPAQSTVANRFGAYWNNQDQKLLFAELKGAFANSDIATAKMYEDSNVFSARGFLAAIAKMGDLQDNTLNKIVVHSSTYAEMKAQQLIDTVQPAGAVTPISVYNGMRIVQDDDPNLINADGSTTSYVFANGAVGYSVANPQNAVEIQREARTNGGQTNVINRRVVTTHILGTSVAKTFTPAGQTVTMDELAKGTTWESIVDPRHIQVIAYKAKLDKEFAPVVPTKSDPVGK
ncbi:replication protein [Limosilactobacillus pontis]|uniref:replication protein n=1 Tax=Limosilactobacillus pontis TaxID=35787 RepID=UPI0025A48BA5|nr:replication protein [Limosilactobacillus pontis]MDM8331520.1 replication protein [Limosilactobacillus pontis]